MYFVEEEYEEEKVKAPVRTVLGCGKMAEMLLQKYPLQRYPWTRDAGTTNALGGRLGSRGTGGEKPLAIGNGDPPQESGDIYTYGSGESYSSRGITAEKSVSISSSRGDSSKISSWGGNSSSDSNGGSNRGREQSNPKLRS